MSNHQRPLRLHLTVPHNIGEVIKSVGKTNNLSENEVVRNVLAWALPTPKFNIPSDRFIRLKRASHSHLFLSPSDDTNGVVFVCSPDTNGDNLQIEANYNISFECADGFLKPTEVDTSFRTIWKQKVFHRVELRDLSDKRFSSIRLPEGNYLVVQRSFVPFTSGSITDTTLSFCKSERTLRMTADELSLFFEPNIEL